MFYILICFVIFKHIVYHAHRVCKAMPGIPVKFCIASDHIQLFTMQNTVYIVAHSNIIATWSVLLLSFHLIITCSNIAWLLYTPSDSDMYRCDYNAFIVTYSNILHQILTCTTVITIHLLSHIPTYSTRFWHVPLWSQSIYCHIFQHTPPGSDMYCRYHKPYNILLSQCVEAPEENSQ
jgi:hypothetical protein